MHSKTDLELTLAWRAVQQNWWAYDALAVACKGKPRRAWRLLGVLAQDADTRELVRDLGCGPLEDFVQEHAPAYINQIERRAHSDPRFARALKHVNIPAADDDVSLRLLALGCRPVPVRPASWQRRRPKSMKTKNPPNQAL